MWIDPDALGTADAGPVCRCDDGCEYATKGTNNHSQVPHSEWLCTQLGEVIGIAAPPCAVIEMPNGDLVFGSRWEGGVVPAQPPWWEQVKNGRIPLDNVKEILTKIYAFDHFVHNIDRHAKNFIMRSQRSSEVLMANDYSRAWLVHGFPLPQTPMDENSNTVKAQRRFTEYFGTYIDPVEACSTMERIKAIPSSRIQNIIEFHPLVWLDDNLKGRILDWWGNGEMNTRAEHVAKGIEDGTHL